MHLQYINQLGFWNLYFPEISAQGKATAVNPGSTPRIRSPGKRRFSQSDSGKRRFRVSMDSWDMLGHYGQYCMNQASRAIDHLTWMMSIWPN